MIPLAERKRQYTYLLVPSGAFLVSQISSARLRLGKWVFTVEAKESQKAVVENGNKPYFFPEFSSGKTALKKGNSQHRGPKTNPKLPGGVL